MSHYIFRKKAFVEMPNGTILPLCYYADSSVTDVNYDCRGRRHEYHPAHWGIQTLGAGKSILIKKEDYNKARDEEYARQVELLEDFHKSYPSPNDTPVTGDSINYAGNSYPGGRKLKNLRSYYSTRNTIPFEEFIRRNCGGFGLSLERCDKHLNRLESEHFSISTTEEMYTANDCYVTYRNRNDDDKNDGYIVIGVSGVVEN